MSSFTRALLLRAEIPADLDQRLVVYQSGACELLTEAEFLDESGDTLEALELGGVAVSSIVDLTRRNGPVETSAAALGLFLANAYSGADMWRGYDDYENACRAIDEGIGTKRAKAKAKRAVRRYF